MNTAPASEVRVALPLNPQQRELVEQAAAQCGQSLDEFATSALLERALQIIQNGSVRVLSQRDARRFLELLDADVEPNEALRSAAEQYRKCHG